MKKTKTAERASAAKAGNKRKTVEEYLAALPDPARSRLQELREAIQSVMPPGASEVISYGIPAFKARRVLVWYAAFSKHCSLFPTAAVLAAFKDGLHGFTVSKGTVQFPFDKPLPVSLIKKLVKVRVAQEK
ncbi:MAG TPA: DUF1801 domain-containing protein [Terriglobales bacterium]|nr:DUF1801 domain-containing protein [Terriglobales bacterium]